MPEEHREALRTIAENGMSPGDVRILVWVITSLALGWLARTLIDSTPIDWTRLIGEMILAVIAGVTLFAFGVLQQMDGWQMVMLGGLAGLGGVRIIEWIMALAKQLPGRDK